MLKEVVVKPIYKVRTDSVDVWVDAKVRDILVSEHTITNQNGYVYSGQACTLQSWVHILNYYNYYNSATVGRETICVSECIVNTLCNDGVLKKSGTPDEYIYVGNKKALMCMINVLTSHHLTVRCKSDGGVIRYIDLSTIRSGVNSGFNAVDAIMLDLALAGF